MTSWRGGLPAVHSRSHVLNKSKFGVIACFGMADANARLETDRLLAFFVSAYEENSWVGATLDFPDRDIRNKKAVDLTASRSDGKTLAIEHTLLQPSVGYKNEKAAFQKTFKEIIDDESLIISGRNIEVTLPIGSLDGRTRYKEEIVDAIHNWLTLHLPELVVSELRQRSEHGCSIRIASDRIVPDIRLSVFISERFPPQRSKEGYFTFGMQGNNDFPEVMHKALKDKLDKLVATDVSKWILMFEREEFRFDPDQIITEFARQKPDVSDKLEIWIMEKVLHTPEQGNFGFEGFDSSLQGIESFSFDNWQLTARSKDGKPDPYSSWCGADSLIRQI
jgi:hypothetical protein